MIFGFKQRFWEPVKSGKKRHTVRRRRANARVGMTMHLDGRVRTRDQFRLVVPEPDCTAINTIIIYESSIFMAQDRFDDEGFERVRWAGTPTKYPVVVQGVDFNRLSDDEMEAFAVADGFANWEEMRQFWIDENGADCFPFVGEVYYW